MTSLCLRQMTSPKLVPKSSHACSSPSTPGILVKGIALEPDPFVLNEATVPQSHLRLLMLFIVAQTAPLAMQARVPEALRRRDVVSVRLQPNKNPKRACAEVGQGLAGE